MHKGLSPQPLHRRLQPCSDIKDPIEGVWCSGGWLCTSSRLAPFLSHVCEECVPPITFLLIGAAR